MCIRDSITHYVEVHFEELKDVVNELGGIQVNVPESFYSDTSGISREAGEDVYKRQSMIWPVTRMDG